MCHALTQGIRTIKNCHEVQKVLLSINLSQKKHKELVSNVEITLTKFNQLVTSKVSSINYPYFDFLLLKCITLLVLKFMISNKFYYVQKVKRLNFVHGD